MIFAIKNSVTGQIEQLVEKEHLDDVLFFLNAAAVKDGGEPVSFESEKYTPPKAPVKPDIPTIPLDED